MARNPHDRTTMDLLSWQPPEPVVAFAPEQVRAASLRSQFSKALGLAMKECGIDREALSVIITEYLGEKVSKDMLDAYASEARDEHVINVVRLKALLHATRDRRLAQWVVEDMGWSVVDNRHLPAIQAAEIAEKWKNSNWRMATRCGACAGGGDETLRNLQTDRSGGQPGCR